MRKYYLRFCPFWGFKSLIKIDSQHIIIEESNLMSDMFVPSRCSQKFLLSAIHSTTISSSYNSRQLITSIFLILVGTIVITRQFIIGNGLICIGLYFFDISLRTNLFFQKSGSKFNISVPFFEEEKLFEIQNQINIMLDMNTHKSNENSR